MAPDQDSTQGTTRLLLAATLLLQVIGTWEIVETAFDLQVSARSWKWVGLFSLLGLLLLGTLVMLLLIGRPAGRIWLARLAARVNRPTALRRLALPGAALFALALPFVVLPALPQPLDRLTDGFFLRMFVFWMAAIFGAGFLHLQDGERSFPKSLAITCVVYAGVYRIAAFLPEISTDPFSLGWSEASRYYYASLFAGERVYGHPVSPTVLHPTRYMLQALPFLFGRLPLWFHRAWQVFLWVAVNGAAAWLLTRRVQARGRLPVRAVVFAAWSFLFLFQGPIWYHLVVMIIIVVWGTSPRRFWKTLLVVGVASIWAGISRVNWIPFPAALAALIYLLEVPVSGRHVFRYLAPPLAWGITGGLLGLFSQWAYAVLSGNTLDQFTSSFTSDLLWYRLLPNATYPPGIVPGILLVLVPPLWAVLSAQRGRWRTFEPVRLLGIAGILLVFLAGGLVVSVKIGGGSNLHNLDGFIALLLVAAAYLVFVLAPRERRLSPLIAGAAIAVPVGFALATGGSLPVYDPAAVAEDLEALSGMVTAEADQGREVLFIAERHLLSFGRIDRVRLVEEYEKVFLMEMAMAGNPEYLGRLEEDLASHRFALIVTDTVNIDNQSRDRAFADENTVWDTNVSYPLLCFYRPVLTLQTTSVQVLAPRVQPGCP